MFKLYSHSEIDKDKWDQCISNSKRPSVYAISWYLDTVSPNWMGLINEDYSQVIPLCWRKKYGIKYLFQPPYTQFGGLFSNQNEPADFCIHAGLLSESFKFIEIRLNPSNYSEKPELVYATGTNQFINLKSFGRHRLAEGEAEINKSIHPTHRKNIRRAIKANIKIDAIEPAEFLKFKFKNQGEYEEEVSTLPALISSLQQHQAINCYGAFNSDQEIITAIMLIDWRKRSILLTSATTEEGINQKAMFLLVHHCLEMNAGKDRIFDFAGSSLPGVYDFNKGFGASEESIQSIRINNLPSLLKLLKS